METTDWAAAEVAGADLGDERRNRRLIGLVTALAARPEGSVPQACEDWAATKGAYRFWDLDTVDPAALRAAGVLAVLGRVQGRERVLVVQDTTEIAVRSQAAALGPLRTPGGRGLLLHSALAVGMDGVPLGLVHQAVWTRDPAQTGKAATRRQRRITEKESGRWLTALAASQAVLPDAAASVPVADREADLYELFAAPRRATMPTALPVPDLAAASEIVRLYTLRWLIERYHFVLKSGCGVEELHLETRERLERALATYALVAWRLLWLTYLARREPDTPCDRILATYEWQALSCTHFHTPLPPAGPPTLHDAIRWIAQLGGFLGRRHDGEPGVVTIWRGLRRLDDIAATWLLLHQPPPTPT